MGENCYLWYLYALVGGGAEIPRRPWDGVDRTATSRESFNSGSRPLMLGGGGGGVIVLWFAPGVFTDSIVNYSIYSLILRSIFGGEIYI